MIKNRSRTRRPRLANAEIKKARAHLFTPHPIRQTNINPTGDSYWKPDGQYRSPTGENSKHTTYGGYARDGAPLDRLNYTTQVSPRWQIDDYKLECQDAIRAGLDGWTVELLEMQDMTTANQHWTRAKQLATAMDELNNGMDYCPMPDVSASIATPQDIANVLIELSAFNCIARLNGRILVSPFCAERKDIAYWQSLVDNMLAAGKEIVLWPCFVSSNSTTAGTSNATQWLTQPWCVGISHWGSRNPAQSTNAEHALCVQAHNAGKLYMAPVSVQDNRPREGIADESLGLQNLERTMQSAGFADAIQVVTWSDHAETSAVRPTQKHGFTFVDVLNKKLSKWKSGTVPAADDFVALLHRQHSHEAVPTWAGYDPALIMKLRNGSTPFTNTVYCYTDLRAATTVVLRSGSTNVTYTAPAGEFTQTLALTAGTVSATLTRGSSFTLTSPYTVITTPEIQDLQYCAVSTKITF